jgi:hypothetical protein
VDGEAVSGSTWRPLLEEAGFAAGYRGHVLRSGSRSATASTRTPAPAPDREFP